jgi:rubrerythrin
MEREEEKMNDIDTVIKWLEDAEYFKDAANYLKQMKPRYSKWVIRSASLGASDVIICEECKFPTDKKRLYNYCPSCGAIMSIGDIYKIN